MPGGMDRGIPRRGYPMLRCRTPTASLGAEHGRRSLQMDGADHATQRIVCLNRGRSRRSAWSVDIMPAGSCMIDFPRVIVLQPRISRCEKLCANLEKPSVPDQPDQDSILPLHVADAGGHQQSSCLHGLMPTVKRSRAVG